MESRGKNEKWKKIIVERTPLPAMGETPMAGTSGRPKGQSPRLRGRRNKNKRKKHRLKKRR
jgi:hypothetical protein